jgi:hypothetical protein
MPLPETLLSEIRQSQRRLGDWFSVEEIRRRDPDLEVAARYIQKATGRELVVPRDKKGLYERLDDWAARLLEHEVRLYEQRIWELCSESSAVPSPEEDALLHDEMMQFMNSSVEQLKEEISRSSEYMPHQYGPRSKLHVMAERMTAEMAITIPLAGEIARLELLDAGYEPVDRIGYAQMKMERFFATNYAKIAHPFNDKRVLSIPIEILRRAIRLVTYVVFRKTNEPRLQGLEARFVGVFLRYLSCSRESSGPVVEQVAALWEPFVKKSAFVFKIADGAGKPVWKSGLDGLISGLGLSVSDLRRSEHSYWENRSVEDGILRLAYQLRHKGAHEAHEYVYYELERQAYFVFAALLVSCKFLAESNPEIAEVAQHQGDVDAVRDLFVRIDDLTIGLVGPRERPRSGGPPNRLEKLVSLSSRSQAVWPNCSARLRSLLESEHAAVKDELVEADREANLEAYLEAMREEQY